MSIEHLSKERDATGYLKPYGWVHTIAHSSELLLRAVCHSMFQKELAEPVLNAVAAMFMKQENVFSDREEKRVGLVLLEMLEQFAAENGYNTKYDCIGKCAGSCNQKQYVGLQDGQMILADSERDFFEKLKK